MEQTEGCLHLIKRFETALSKAQILSLAEAADYDFPVGDLLQLTLNKQLPAVAFRASWVLENIKMQHPQKFAPYLEQFLAIYPQQSNESCRRTFTKIMMLSMDDILKDERLQHMLDSIVEATFDWLAGDTPVAVQVNCMDVLFMLRNRYDWIGEELQAQTEFLLRDGSAAMQSRGKRILKKLRKKH